MSLRGLYKVFNETRKAAREKATVAVTGGAAGTERLAGLLGAGRVARGAQVVLTLGNGPDGGAVLGISGKAVEEDEEVTLRSDPVLSPADELLAEVAPRIVEALDEGYLIPLGRGYEAFRRSVCEEVIRNNARQNAFIGALPVPGADLPVMTANQGRMVLAIASVYGEDITLQRARELAGVLGAGLGFRAIGRQVAKLVPFGGWAVAAAIGYGGTLAMGRVAVLYFERGRAEPAPEEVSGIRERAVREAREFASRFSGTSGGPGKKGEKDASDASDTPGAQDRGRG